MNDLSSQYGSRARPSNPVDPVRSACQMAVFGNLEKKDFFGSSDPYLVLKRSFEDGSLREVVRTETVKNSLNPMWRPLRISVQKLCNGDYDRPITAECWDWNSSGNDEMMGSAQTSLRELMQPRGELSLRHWSKKKQALTDKSSGQIVIAESAVAHNFTFLDYVRGGLEVSLIVSVDFTASNGNPASPQSLHFMSPYQNCYEQVISSVGEILAAYDADGMFPAFGFGGMINGRVSHCFALNGDPQNSEVRGVSGILTAYRNALSQVPLHGPTLFAPTIATAHAYATQSAQLQSSKKYYVLLIITGEWRVVATVTLLGPWLRRCDG